MKLHKLKKHDVVAAKKNVDYSIEKCLKMACSKEIEKAFYGNNIMEEIRTYLLQLEESIIHKNALLMLNTQVNKAVNFKFTEKFYVTFYENVVKERKIYFPTLTDNASLIIIQTFADILLHTVNEEVNVKDDIVTKNIK